MGAVQDSYITVAWLVLLVVLLVIEIITVGLTTIWGAGGALAALILNILCYQLFYRVIPARQEKLAEIFTRKEILTVPNLLSFIRLGLAVLFLGICERHGMRGNRPVLTMIIMAAAATDFLDGRIARAFHQVSKIGRQTRRCRQ